MFSSSDKRFHSKRRRIFASAYSKTAVCQPRTYDIIRKCTNKLANFLESATSEVQASMGLSRPIVMRNIFRVLQSDIFTAFAFSEETGTRYLDGLNAGSNSLEELGMTEMDLLHDEKRDRVFCWESETPLKYIGRLLGWDGPELHRKAQKWLLRIIQQHETSVQTRSVDSNHQEALKPFESTVYENLRTCKDGENGQNLTLEERASEIMDHAGTCLNDPCLLLLDSLTNKRQVAGQDAVSAALEYTVRQLSKHADFQSRLRLELLSSLSLDEQEGSMAMIDSLPYLNAVLMESLRTVDTVSSYQTRVVPKGGCSISGYFLPEGVSSLVKLILGAFLVTYFFRPSSHANHTSSIGCPTCSPTQTTLTPRDGYFLKKTTKHCQSIYGLTRAGPRAASDVTFLLQVPCYTLYFIS